LSRDELLFILSSEDRVRMLSALGEEGLKLSPLSSKVSITIQEASRQVGRLHSAKLVEKDTEGLYVLTNLGRTALKLLPSFDFLVDNSSYLLAHSLSDLPPGFVERLGELTGAEQGKTLGDILRHFQEVMDGAGERVWLMADHVLLLDEVAAKARCSEGLSIRVVIPRSVTRDGAYGDLLKGFRGDMELGLVDNVQVGMALNEKVAGVVFPDRDGRVDFDGGLRGHSPAFIRWCSDLFLFHWNEATKVSFEMKR
jgi:predicted transcriptional regulator